MNWIITEETQLSCRVASRPPLELDGVILRYLNQLQSTPVDRFLHRGKFVLLPEK